MLRLLSVLFTNIESPTPARFKSDDRGQVMIIFGLMLFVLAVVIGAAVDMGRWAQARKMTQEAIDSAVLAGLKKYQDTGDEAAAISVAQSNYNYNIRQRDNGAVSGDTISFVLTTNNTSMAATGNVAFTLPFLGLANTPKLPLFKTDGSENAVSKIAIGANTGSSIEVSVMIDITGSMAESDNSGSTKIATVKTAAANLIDIIVWADQSQYTSKVAIVPFSEAVNLGDPQIADAARGPAAGKQSGPCNGNGNCQNYPISNVCVTERLVSEAYTDEAPDTAPVGNYYSTYGTSNGTGKCPTATPVIPLTNNKMALKDTIAGLAAAGGTAGHIGTAWAWYMLSPNFNDLWPASSKARPYSELTVLNNKGKPALQKVAILMTDGDYNTQYCSGLNTNRVSCQPDNDWSQNQAMNLCNGMKAKGITVYTIGAQVSANAKAFLQQCATDARHYYDATDGNKLNQAFIDIAYKLVPPYLSH